MISISLRDGTDVEALAVALDGLRCQTLEQLDLISQEREVVSLEGTRSRRVESTKPTERRVSLNAPRL